MIAGLIKYDLDYRLTIRYFERCFDDANLLSSQMLRKIKSDSGMFFTLLPVNSNIKRKYQFPYGGILPQNPIIEYGAGPKKSRHQIIPTIRDELSEFINSKIQQTRSICCVIDDVTLSKKDYVDAESDLFEKFGLFFKDEVYFVLKKDAVSKENILRCLRASNAFWHSLCVLTEANIDLKYDRELTTEKIY